jgi:beta-glucosidase
MELKGFRRMTLQPGATSKARFSIPAETLAFFDTLHRLIVEPGRVLVLLGSSSADIRLQGEFSITGPTRVVSARREYFTYCE